MLVSSTSRRGRGVVDESLDEMGPIDYVVLEWPGRQPTGEAAPLILDLVDRGIIRILDVAFLVKDEDGSSAAVSLDEVAAAEFGEFAGASSGLLGDDDLEEAAAALNPGTVGGGVGVGEPLGGAGRGGAAAFGWAVGGVGSDSGSGDPGRRWTRPRRTAEEGRLFDAWFASWCCADGGCGGYGDGGQQSCLAPSGQSLVTAGR